MITAGEILLAELGLSEMPKHRLIMEWYDIVELMENYAKRKIAELEALKGGNK